MRFNKLYILALFFIPYYASSQDIISEFDIDTVSVRKFETFSKILNSLHVEGTVSLNLVNGRSFDFLSNNYSFFNSPFIFSLGIHPTKNLLLGVTSLDSKINGTERHIHQFYLNYLFYNRTKFILYYSHKLPARKWEELNNQQFMYSRLGVGSKILLFDFNEVELFVDLNYDLLGFQISNEPVNGIFLMGLSVNY